MNQIISQANFLQTRSDRELGNMILSASRVLYDRSPANMGNLVVKDINSTIDVIIQKKP